MHADVTAGTLELERQANHFGSALLMPRNAFFHEAPRRIGWEHVWALEGRWKVSAAGIVRRSYDPGVISEIGYRRAFVHLNQAGERTSEPHEPPPEQPVARRKALEVIANRWRLPRIAEVVGVTACERRELIAFTEPAPLHALPAVDPAAVRGDGPLITPWHGDERPDDV